MMGEDEAQEWFSLDDYQSEDGAWSTATENMKQDVMMLSPRRGRAYSSDDEPLRGETHSPRAAATDGGVAHDVNEVDDRARGFARPPFGDG